MIIWLVRPGRVPDGRKTILDIPKPAPRRLQNSLGRPQSGLGTAQGSSRTTPGRTRAVQERPGTAQESPRTAPGRPQGIHKTDEDCPMTASKRSQKGPRGSQDRPRRPGRPKTTQDVPRTAQDGFKTRPRPPQDRLRGAREPPNPLPGSHKPLSFNCFPTLFS